MSQSKPDFNAAVDFIWTTARLIDRLRFAHVFKGLPAAPVVAALRAYQNADGGFGNGLEPDIRAVESLPIPTWAALVQLDEVGAFDDPMVGQALAYLQTITTAEGGVPFVLPSVMKYPRAPWWQTEENPPASINPTAAIVALLFKNHVEHPWLGPAAAYCWRHIDTLEATTPYDARAILPFLTHAPDRDRAEAAFKKLSKLMLDGGLVALDPDATGEVHFPLMYAPRPDAIARRMFSDEVIARHLDALAAGQQADGGWTINFLAWTPYVGLVWRGVVTVDALITLKVYGRL